MNNILIFFVYILIREYTQKYIMIDYSRALKKYLVGYKSILNTAIYIPSE